MSHMPSLKCEATLVAMLKMLVTKGLLMHAPYVSCYFSRISGVRSQDPLRKCFIFCAHVVTEEGLLGIYSLLFI